VKITQPNSITQKEYQMNQSMCT